MRILIVDDDEVALLALEQALSYDGHEVVCARDGRDALERIHSEPLRMVISDWTMPRLSGLDLCRAVRDADLLGYVYFILLTSRGGAQDVVNGLSAGADDFVTKPFEPEELRVRVRAGMRVLSLETRDMAIFALAKLAESRDPETGAHLERVRSYCKLLAQRMALLPVFRGQVDAEFVRLIYLTSPLHDIGKVGIPDGVLLKAGRLTNREFEIMKTHTTIGAETLEAALRQYPEARFLHMARDIALTHHEWFDGSGYPSGLSGRDIPLCGRVVALADVYDALTSRRVYKAAFTHDIARNTIVAESQTHFDPRIVDAFLESEVAFREVSESMAELEPAAN